MKLLITILLLSSCATRPVTTTTFKTDHGYVKFRHGDDGTLPTLFIQGKYYFQSSTTVVK